MTSRLLSAYTVLQELENRPLQIPNLDFIHQVFDLAVSCFPFVHVNDWNLLSVTDDYQLTGNLNKNFNLLVTIGRETSHSRVINHSSNSFDEIDLTNSEWSNFIAWFSYVRELFEQQPKERKFFEIKIISDVNTHVITNKKIVPNLIGLPFEVTSNMWIETNEQENVFRHVDIYKEPKSDWVQPPVQHLLDVINIAPLDSISMGCLVQEPKCFDPFDPAVFIPIQPQQYFVPKAPLKQPNRVYTPNCFVDLKTVKEDTTVDNLDLLDFDLKHCVSTQQWVKEAAESRRKLKEKFGLTTEGKNG